jgi:predicted XRE-type DNA-binding protein
MAKKDYVVGSGNVFADLELPDADEKLAKAELAIKIAEILRQRRLTQMQAAEVLGVDQPKVSALLRGRISGFSIERMLRFLLRLGADVSITVKYQSPSNPRAARQAGKFPVEGSLSVDEIVAERASRSRKKQPRAA